MPQLWMVQLMNRFIFQIKRLDQEDWSTVSDDEFMYMLYDSYNKTTPLIKEMLTGKQVHAKGCAYRIRVKCKEDGGLICLPK